MTELVQAMTHAAQTSLKEATCIHDRAAVQFCNMHHSCTLMLLPSSHPDTTERGFSTTTSVTPFTVTGYLQMTGDESKSLARMDRLSRLCPSHIRQRRCKPLVDLHG